MTKSLFAVGALATLMSGCVVALDDDEPVTSQEQILLGDDLNDAVRARAEDHGLRPHPRPERLDALAEADPETVAKRSELGRFLFFDKALSAIDQTSCGTCHHAAFAFGDGRTIARGVFCVEDDDGFFLCDEAPAPGEDGNVVGPGRTAPLNERNTPSAMNSALFPKQMWNGRFRFVDDSSTDVNDLDPSQGFLFPDPEGLMFTRSLLTAQAHVPVIERPEMTGDFPEPDHDNIRALLAERISNMPAYRELFEDAYAPGTELTPLDPVVGPGEPISYLAIADAIAHFQEQQLTMTDAPWDRFLAGDDDAMSEDAKRGALLFFGRAQCVSCHSGDLFSDFENHNIGVPQIGPGTGGFDPAAPYQGFDTWDFGLEDLTDERADRFRFRTPPLRGVALTSPYMHGGQFELLEDAIRHHLNPRQSYATYDTSNVEDDVAAHGLRPLQPVFDLANPVAIGPGTGIRPAISEREIFYLVEFLAALTDPRMRDSASLAPQELPSGLPPDVVGPANFPVY